MKWIIKYILPCLFFMTAYSMNDVEVGHKVPAYIDEVGDTIPHVMLQQVYVFPKLVFKNEKQERFY